MTDLLPCPFCGKPGAMCELEEEPGSPMSFWVNCSCGIETPERRTEAEAVALWNTRALAQPAPAGREITDAMVNAGAGVLWNDRDARMGGPWKGRGADEVCVIQTKATMRAALQAALSLSPHNGGSEEERELFAAATKIDLAGALMHIRDWRSYIDDHHRQKYADLIEAQAKLVSLLIAKRSVAAPPPPVADRAAIIEECAKIVEDLVEVFPSGWSKSPLATRRDAVAAIRSLAPKGDGR